MEQGPLMRYWRHHGQSIIKINKMSPNRRDYFALVIGGSETRRFDKEACRRSRERELNHFRRGGTSPHRRAAEPRSAPNVA